MNQSLGRIGICLVWMGSPVLGDITQRTVDPRELGTLFTNENGFTWADVGAKVNSAKVGYFGTTNPNAEKISHGRFQHIKPSDDTTWCYLPYTQLKTDYPSLFVTATYQGRSRPVYYNWSLGLSGNQPTAPASEWRQAIHVSDDRYVDFWVNSYVQPIAWTNVAGMTNRWIGIDEGAFIWNLYGVLDDTNHFVPGVPWDAPFPQNEAQYLSMIQTFFSKVKTRYPAIPIMINLGSLADPASFPTVFADVPGIMEENMYDKGGTDYERNQNYWNIVNLSWFGAQPMPADPTRARVALLRAYASATDPADIRTALMLYMLVRGPNFFFAPAMEGTILSFNPTAWQGMRLALGNPVGPFQSALEPGKPNGYRLYWRLCDKGIVYLNWSGVAKTITLPAGAIYKDHTGTPVTQITLPDRTGDFVTVTPPSGGVCDLNADGATNVLDVQRAVNQALGIVTPCTADINQDGQCNVLDVQRVTNAALGGTCVSP